MAEITTCTETREVMLLAANGENAAQVEPLAGDWFVRYLQAA
jgi:hypothetical protein